MGDEMENDWFNGRKVDHVYLSRSFELTRPGSKDDGQPARFLHKVFDDGGCTSAEVELNGEVWPISESDSGRVQVKMLIARDGDNIKDLWIQKWKPNKANGARVSSILHLGSRDAQSLVELFQNLHYLPVEGDESVRIDDAAVKQILSNPTALSRYGFDSNIARTFVEQDETATDVIALAGRRAAIERFKKLLEDRSYFEDERNRLGLKGDEAVWQHLFEENPWILGISLTSQLLTSWDDDRLEQVVRGFSISTSGKRADAVLRTAGLIRSMVFAEFKTAETQLLSSKPYRPGVWAPSKELSGGVSQVHTTVNLAVREIGERIASRSDDGFEIPNDWTYLFNPRSYLVVGSYDEFIGVDGGHNVDKIRSFELYRRSISSPEIITFDELLARAQWIVGLSADVSRTAN